MKLYMTTREIEYEYLHAVKKRKQINILAELNGTVPLAVCHILYERNVLDVSGSIGRRYYAMRLMHEGKTAGYIERELGIPPGRVEGIRRELQENGCIFEGLQLGKLENY